MNSIEQTAQLFERLKARAEASYDTARDDDRRGAILVILHALITTRDEAYRELFGDLHSALDAGGSGDERRPS